MVQVLLMKPANSLALPKWSILNNVNSGGQNRKYKPKFYILGHGQTGTNASGRIQGMSDFSKLTELGKYQDKALGKELGMSFAFIFFKSHFYLSNVRQEDQLLLQHKDKNINFCFNIRNDPPQEGTTMEDRPAPSPVNSRKGNKNPNTLEIVE